MQDSQRSSSDVCGTAVCRSGARSNHALPRWRRRTNTCTHKHHIRKHVRTRTRAHTNSTLMRDTVRDVGKFTCTSTVCLTNECAGLRVRALQRALAVNPSFTLQASPEHSYFRSLRGAVMNAPCGRLITQRAPQGLRVSVCVQASNVHGGIVWMGTLWPPLCLAA